MKNLKTLLLLTLLALSLVSVLSINLASAEVDYSICASFQGVLSSMPVAYSTAHPSLNGDLNYHSATSQAFAAGVSGTLDKIKVGFIRVGSPNVTFAAKIYSIADYTATTSVETGTLLGTSTNNFTVSSATTSTSAAFPTLVYFEFESIQITSGSHYGFVIYVNNVVSANAANTYPTLSTDSATTNYAGKAGRYNNGGWLIGNNDLNFEVLVTNGTPDTPDAPEGYINAEFGADNGGNVTWRTATDETGMYSRGNLGTYQLVNGSKVTATAVPAEGYVFDHWTAVTGEYTFSPTFSPLIFTATANFNLTANYVLANASQSYLVSMPVTTGGYIDFDYTGDGTSYNNQRYASFWVKTGTVLSLTAHPDSGYTCTGINIDPASGLRQTSSDYTDLAYFITQNCTITGIFSDGDADSGNYWDDSQADNGAYTWINTYLPFIVPLLIILASAFLGWKFGGNWGFFAGLNVGVILGYIIVPTLIPLWAVIAILVLDGAILFGKVSHRGE